MDYNRNSNNQINQSGSFNHNPGNSLANAAMFLGIAALFTIFTIYFSLLLGSIAIILAILSKGYGKKLIGTAKVGIGCALGSVGVTLALLISTVSLLLNCSGEDLISFGRQMDQQYEDQTGVSLEDTFGESYEDVMKEYVNILGK